MSCCSRAATRAARHGLSAGVPELRGQYRTTLQLLELNPFHPSLRLHKLSGALADVHSVSINLSYRITIEFLIDGSNIIPVDVGSHDNIY